MRYTNNLDDDFAAHVIPTLQESPARLHVGRVAKVSLPPGKTILALSEKETGTSLTVEARQVHVFRLATATPARARRRRPPAILNSSVALADPITVASKKTPAPHES